MKEQAQILLVEDDVNFGSVLKSFLEMQEYKVTLCNNGEKGYSAFRAGSFDLCLVDVMMPFKDGFSLVSEIRRHDELVPVVFITAKSMKQDMLQGFEAGADDYITKPFDSEILLHKIKALLRRRAKPENGAQDNKPETNIGKFIFSYEKRLLSGLGTEHTLSPREAELLKMLCNGGNVLDRHVALVKLWGEDNYFTARSMDVYISRLRRYLKPDVSISIVNIQRKGFRLVVSGPVFSGE